MERDIEISSITDNPEDVPVKVINFSRWVNLVLLVFSLIAQKPLGTTLLLALLLPSIIFGRKWNLIGRIGKFFFWQKGEDTQYESRRIIYFNNIILISLLSFAQAAFLAGLNITGWSIIVLVIIANGLALSGFCVGCVLYFRFKLYKHKILGDNY